MLASLPIKLTDIDFKEYRCPHCWPFSDLVLSGASHGQKTKSLKHGCTPKKFIKGENAQSRASSTKKTNDELI